jgi:uncharacterized protein (TIGR03437 family)
VLVFATPNSLPSGNGTADRVMGVVPLGEIATLGLTGLAATTLELQTWLNQPAGIFFLTDGSVCIMDTGDSRIMIFPPYSQWDSEDAHYSPLATTVAGQGGSFLMVAPNNAQTLSIANGTPPASGSTFFRPTAAAYLPTTRELFVADTGNNRVMVMPSAAGFGSATRILGQDRANTNSPNLIEGREFQFVASNATGDAGIALDSSGTTPHLYVSDPYNHRVLGYYDARLVTAGKKADLVIGQPDFQTALCNYNPAASNGIGGDTSMPTASSLCVPIGLAVDPAGNLYVADSRNGRVLRFPAPFANYPKVATLEPADLVLGQAGFTAQVRQAGYYTMYSPYGLAFSGVNGLVVSDAALNRVLYFPFSADHTFTAPTDNGKTATKVFGQPDFYSKSAGTGAGSLNSPMHISSDGEGRLYVADAGNNRVSVFPDPNSPYTPSGIQAAWTITGLNSPRGVWINPVTDEIWIANTGSGSCVRYSSFSALYVGAPPNFAVPAVSYTLALTTDQNGALYVADQSNRVAIYYPALQSLNGASFLANRTLAPGLIASLCGYGSNCGAGAPALFGSQTASYSGFPASTLLGDVQVSFNGTLAPLFYTSPTQINLYVPSNAPTSGSANVEVVQKSTGQVLAAGLAQMSNASPGIFMLQFTGTSRQAAVLNQDYSVNSQSNPAVRGKVISIYATGQGVIPGMPADGVAAGVSPLVVVPKSLTQVLIGTCLLAEGNSVPTNCPNQPGDVGTSGSVASDWIPFSGLAPGFAGLWQINAQIPMAVLPGPAVIEVVFNGMASIDPVTTAPFKTVIYVK